MVNKGVLVRCILLSKTCIILRGYHVNRRRHVEGVADPITKVSWRDRSRLTIKKSYISFLYYNIQIPRKSKVHFLPIIWQVFPNLTFVNKNSRFFGTSQGGIMEITITILKFFFLNLRIYKIHDFLQIGREGNIYSIWKWVSTTEMKIYRKLLSIPFKQKMGCWKPYSIKIACMVWREISGEWTNEIHHTIWS
jgi:hypothetical protein